MANGTSNLRRIMRRNLIEAYQGWWIWHRLVKRYRLGRTRVILMPAENRDYNYCALLYLDQMLDAHQYENAIILTVDSVAETASNLFSDRILAVEKISRTQAEHLMRFYCLYEFDARFVVASLEEPNGRNATGLIGKNGTTIEELMAIGVYQLPHFEKEAPPDYIGNDLRLKYFLYGEDAAV